MTVGELIAFNMIACQVVQPILRLSQLWQDFQQVQVSVARLGDILNAPPEPAPQSLLTLPPPTRRDRIARRDAALSARRGRRRCATSRCRSPRAKSSASSAPSGSGKSTLTKLVQRLYQPADPGRCMIDGVDVAQLDPGLAAPPDRRRAAGEHPVQPDDPREHRARRSRRCRGRW